MLSTHFFIDVSKIPGVSWMLSVTTAIFITKSMSQAMIVSCIMTLIAHYRMKLTLGKSSKIWGHLAGLPHQIQTLVYTTSPFSVVFYSSIHLKFSLHCPHLPYTQIFVFAILGSIF